MDIFLEKNDNIAKSHEKKWCNVPHKHTCFNILPLHPEQLTSMYLWLWCHASQSTCCMLLVSRYQAVFSYSVDTIFSCHKTQKTNKCFTINNHLYHYQESCYTSITFILIISWYCMHSIWFWYDMIKISSTQ